MKEWSQVTQEYDTKITATLIWDMWALPKVQPTMEHIFEHIFGIVELELKVERMTFSFTVSNKSLINSRPVG